MSRRLRQLHPERRSAIAGALWCAPARRHRSLGVRFAGLAYAFPLRCPLIYAEPLENRKPTIYHATSGMRLMPAENLLGIAVHQEGRRGVLRQRMGLFFTSCRVRDKLPPMRSDLQMLVWIGGPLARQARPRIRPPCGGVTRRIKLRRERAASGLRGYRDWGRASEPKATQS